MAVSIAVYAWVFELGRCRDRGDVACMLNANQGVLTVLALVLTVAGLWVAALDRIADRRREMARLASHRTRILASALEEAGHNLIHVALAYDRHDHHLRHPPQLSVEEIMRVCDPELQSTVHSRVLRSARAINRNLEAMRGAIAANQPAIAERRLQGLVNNSLRLILSVAVGHPEASREVLPRPGYQDFARLAKRNGGRCYVCFRSSESADEAPALRIEEVPVLCWWDDDAPPGVQVFAEGPRFRDMNHPAH